MDLDYANVMQTFKMVTENVPGRYTLGLNCLTPLFKYNLKAQLP